MLLAHWVVIHNEHIVLMEMVLRFVPARLVPRVAPTGDTGGTAAAAASLRSHRRPSLAPFFLVSDLLAGGKGSGVHLLVDRVHLGLGFARRR
jgi:hypothetical protein